VKPKWIQDCYAEKKRLPEDDYGFEERALQLHYISYLFLY